MKRPKTSPRKKAPGWSCTIFEGIKPSTKYWTNLRRLIKIAGSGSLVQYSVFTTKEKRAAVVAKRLAEHYGAETIVYMVEKVESI